MPQLPNELEKQLAPTTLSLLRGLLDSMKPYEMQPSTGMHFDVQSKYVTWRFDPKVFPDGIELLHITDVQFGHVECHVKRVIEYRDWVLAEPNRFMLWGGDMIDAANVHSPGNHPWDNLFNAQSQVYRFCELWAPARHRVLGYVSGNHERRGVSTFGELGSILATLLQIPYSAGQQLIDIHYGQHKPFKVHLWHGKGAAQTKGAKTMMLYRFMSEHPGSQLYLVGHLHDCIVLPCSHSKRLEGKNDVHMEKYVGGMSSSFLRYWGTYAEVMALTPNDILMLRAVLEANGHWEVSIR